MQDANNPHGMTKAQLRLLELIKHRIKTIGHGRNSDHWVPNESTINKMTPREIYDLFLGWSNEVDRLHLVVNEIKANIDAIE